MKEYKIFSARLAKKLIKSGYHVIDIQPNNANPERTVFIFKGTNELINFVNGYKANN